MCKINNTIVSKSLKQKTIKGTAWSFLDNIAGSGVTFLVGIVLARLLTPAEFGIIGMVTIFIAISNSIIDSGFSSALIRKKDVENIDYNTVFYFNLVLSALLYVMLYFSSPAISRFFEEPQLIAVTRALGLILIVNSFAIIQRTILVKNVDFKIQTIISLISSILSGGVGVVMAFMGYGVWSLVAQQLVRQGLNTILLWVFNKWRPSIEFSIQSFKELFSFGSKLLLSGLLDTVWREIYYIIIGKFYSVSTLGQFTRAQQFQTIFANNLTSIVQRVSYPVLSSIQDEEERLKQAYRKVIKTTMIVTFACLLGLAAIAKPLILILIGEKWLPSVPYLQILCFSGMLYPLHAINLNMLQVKGRSDLFLKLEIIKKIIGLGPLCLGIFISIEWMLLGSVITSFCAYYLNSYYSGRFIKYSTLQQLKDIFPSFIISLIMAGLIWSLTLLSINIYLMLFAQIVLALLILIALYEWSKPSGYIEIREIVFNVVNKVLWKKK